tara:strand:- start:5277 stop:5873 length:597 start_codon:yes stop_codon:yes gene_type:complete
MKPLILIGNGGHAKSLIDVIESTGKYKIIGLIAKSSSEIKTTLLGYKIIGSDKDLANIRKYCENAIIAIGHLGNIKTRLEIIKKLSDFNYKFPSIISKHSIISSHATIGEGTAILHGAIINSGASVGSHCIINSNSLIEHDANIGIHTHISTGVLVNGDVTIGDGSFIGSGAIIREGLKLPSGCIISAGKRIMGWPLL